MRNENRLSPAVFDLLFAPPFFSFPFFFSFTEKEKKQKKATLREAE